MRLAFVFNSLSNTGINITTRDLIFELKKIPGNKIDVYYFDDVNDPIEINVDAFRIKLFSNVNLLKYDIVHGSNLRAEILIFLHKLKTLFNVKKPKYVTSVHSIIEEDLTFTYGRFVGSLLAPMWLWMKKNNDAVFVSSQAMLNHYSKLFKNRNVHIIEYGRSIDPVVEYQIPEEEERLLNEHRSKYKIIGTVGSIIRRKNYSATINLLNQFKDYCWVCLGVGEDLEKLKELVKVNGLEARVLFLGFKKDSRPYYNFFNIFFHPSKSEGFPLVIIDAMAHQVPIVLGNLPVYRSVIKDDMAFYFDVEDESSMFESFNKIENNNRDVMFAKSKSFEVYQEKFAMAIYGRRHFEVFKDILGNKNI